MYAILACAFPLVLVLGIMSCLPVAIPERHSVPDDGQGSAKAPLTYREHLAYSVSYLLVSFAIAYPVGIAQRTLFESAGHDVTSLFSHRATDISLYPFLPAIFLGLVVGFPVCFRLLLWYQGDRIFDLLDRPDRGQTSMTLRQEIQIFSGLAWGVAILATLLNFAVFDTFFEVQSSQFRYSTFFSPTTHQHSVAEVQDLMVYSRRRAPNGNITNKTFLEIRLKDGRTIDTFYLIEPEHIDRVVNSFKRNLAFKGSVRLVNGYK